MGFVLCVVLWGCLCGGVCSCGAWCGAMVCGLVCDYWLNLGCLIGSIWGCVCVCVGGVFYIIWGGVGCTFTQTILHKMTIKGVYIEPKQHKKRV
jgi:hypothetical protein